MDHNKGKDDFRPPSKEEFLYPRSQYNGDFSPQNLAFNANLQEFAHKVGYICALQTGGHLPAAEAYARIKALWHELKESQKSLKIPEIAPPEA